MIDGELVTFCPKGGPVVLSSALLPEEGGGFSTPLEAAQDFLALKEGHSEGDILLEVGQETAGPDSVRFFDQVDGDALLSRIVVRQMKDSTWLAEGAVICESQL